MNKLITKVKKVAKDWWEQIKEYKEEVIFLTIVGVTTSIVLVWKILGV